MMAEAWSLAFPSCFWVLPLVAAICCSIGFKKFVWFLSIGYGFAVAGLGAAMFIMFLPGFTLPDLIVYLFALLLLAYGTRLGVFLLKREKRNSSYRKTLSQTGSDKRFPFGLSLVVWIFVSILFCFQVSPVYYRMSNGTGAQVTCYIGFVISTFGFILEALADHQKTVAKRANPHRFCDSGLYKVVRCPNYLGEMTMWTGVFVSGIGALTGLFQRLFACMGYLSIIAIMFSGARRIEHRQDQNYGTDEAYQHYKATTPILLPLVPLYTLNKRG